MAIKAVFFDLYHTLVTYDPPRDVKQAEALAVLGVEVPPEKVRWPLVVADEYIYGELSRVPMGRRSPEDLQSLWANYMRVFLKEAGIEPNEKLVAGLLESMRAVKWNPVLFADVAPTLADLKGRGMVLGLISNVDKDINPMLEELGLLSWLSIIVTSSNAGYTKPQPEIFHEALKRAGGLLPAEVIYVGDQHEADARGACKAGLRGVLLDRNDYYRGVSDCPRIRSLSDIPELLNS